MTLYGFNGEFSRMAEERVCENPAECCKELTRVWTALGVVAYNPALGSCSTQVGRLKNERDLFQKAAQSAHASCDAQIESLKARNDEYTELRALIVASVPALVPSSLTHQHLVNLLKANLQSSRRA